MAANPLNGVLGLLHEITKCQDAGATASTAIMVYIGIDVMAFLAMPPGHPRQTRDDFIAWVNQYLHAAPNSAYQYDGRDVYGARCAMVHTYSIEADYHAQNPGVKRFGYHDGGGHAYDPVADAGLVIIGINSLVHDFVQAVGRFIQTMIADEALRQRVAERIPQVVQSFPFNAGDGE
jgi:hypothetical protein